MQAAWFTLDLPRGVRELGLRAGRRHGVASCSRSPRTTRSRSGATSRGTSRTADSASSTPITELPIDTFEALLVKSVLWIAVSWRSSSRSRSGCTASSTDGSGTPAAAVHADVAANLSRALEEEWRGSVRIRRRQRAREGHRAAHDVLRAGDGDARQHRRQRRAPRHQPEARRGRQRPPVDRRRLRAGVRLPAAHRRHPRRPLRAQAHVPARSRDLHPRLARLRRSATAAAADRRPRRSRASAPRC